MGRRSRRGPTPAAPLRLPATRATRNLFGGLTVPTGSGGGEGIRGGDSIYHPRFRRVLLFPRRDALRDAPWNVPKKSLLSRKSESNALGAHKNARPPHMICAPVCVWRKRADFAQSCELQDFATIGRTQHWTLRLGMQSLACTRVQESVAGVFHVRATGQSPPGSTSPPCRKTHG